MEYPALRTLISAACTATPWSRTISNANFAAAPNVPSGVIVFSWMCAPRLNRLWIGRPMME
jgi:hypothetical protein